MDFPIPFQSTRPVRGETRAAASAGPHRRISIHSPREGRDAVHIFFAERIVFQSTRPVRGETHRASIDRDTTDFNPLAP